MSKASKVRHRRRRRNAQQIQSLLKRLKECTSPAYALGVMQRYQYLQELYSLATFQEAVRGDLQRIRTRIVREIRQRGGDRFIAIDKK